MKFNVTNAYCMLEGTGIVKMYMISGLPFTFDDDGWSSYLIMEECHPIVFNMEEVIQNYHDVPD